jgi:hypothetical protein
VTSSSFVDEQSVVNPHAPTTEVFLGGVPRTINDEELHQVLQKAADENQLGTISAVSVCFDSLVFVSLFHPFASLLCFQFSFSHSLLVFSLHYRSSFSLPHS